MLPIIQKPEQINWLVSVWWETLVVNGLIVICSLFFHKKAIYLRYIIMKKGVPKNRFARLVCWLKNLQFQTDHMQYPQASPGINFRYQPKKTVFLSDEAVRRLCHCHTIFSTEKAPIPHVRLWEVWNFQTLSKRFQPAIRESITRTAAMLGMCIKLLYFRWSYCGNCHLNKLRS